MFDNSTRDDFEGLNLFTPKNVLYYTDPVTKRMELYKVDATEDEVWNAGPQYTCMLRFPKAYIYREEDAYSLSDTKIDSNYKTEPAFINYRDNTEYRYIEISKFYYNKSTYSCPNTYDFNNVISDHRNDLAYESVYDSLFPELPSNSGKLNLSLNSYICDQYYKKLIAIKFLLSRYYNFAFSDVISSYNRSSNEFSPEVYLHSYWLNQSGHRNLGLIAPTPNILWCTTPNGIDYYFNVYNERAVIGSEGTIGPVKIDAVDHSIGILKPQEMTEKGFPRDIFLPGGDVGYHLDMTDLRVSWNYANIIDNSIYYPTIQTNYSDHNSLIINEITAWYKYYYQSMLTHVFKLYRQVK